MEFSYRNLLNSVKECSDKHICILTHNFPDADAISCAHALRMMLKNDGVESDIYYGGRIDRSSTEKMISVLGIEMNNCDGVFTENDAVIFVDCQAGTGNTKFSGGYCLACIDHHPTNPNNTSEYKYKQVELVGACASLLTEFIIERNYAIEPEVATALLLGLEIDTKNFTREINQKDIDALGFLHTRVDKSKLQNIETSRLIISDLKAYGSAITNMQFVSDLGFSYVPFDCPDALIASLAEFMLDIDEISISIVFSKRSSGIKLSVRSILPFFDAGQYVSNTLKNLGSGGGHAMFAGGFIPNESFAGISEDELQSRLKKLFLKEYTKQLMKSVEF